jgi:aryl-alcohol dehydrogenase-like predicted oxidoreductase
MEYRLLGQSGLMVSELCLGCMTFGREADETTSRAIIRRYLDAGGNFIDTADVYAEGASEEITGRAIRDRRGEIVLATKVRFATGPGPNDVGISRRHIIQGCEASLRRLGTEYIDLYQVHCWDAATPIAETLSALSDLVHQGKVRYIGASNFTAWQIMRSAHVSETRGFEPFVSLQPQYSLVERTIEYEIVPACEATGMSIIPWGPLGGGFLSGKYRPGEQPPEDSRIAHAEDAWEESWRRRAVERNWRILDVVGDIAEQSGKSYAQVALNWVLHRPRVAAPIIGARTVEQLEDNLGAAGWALEAEQARRLSDASALEDVYPYRFIRNAQRI